MICDMTKRKGGSLSGWTTDGIADASEPNGALILGVSEVKDYAFYGRVAITSVSGSSVTKVKTSAFTKCSALTTFDFPNAISLEQNAFAQCVGLTSVHSPKANILTQTCFSGCTNLITIVMPRCINVQYNSTHNTALSALDIGSSDVAPSYNGIQAGAFGTVNNFNVLVLRHAAIMPLGNISAFANTPFKSGGTGGTIYIPKSLYDHLGDGTANDYKAATNWSTIDGYGTITWKSIESTHTDPNAPIDLTLYYADGTPIPTE